MLRAATSVTVFALVLGVGCTKSDRPTDVETVDAFNGKLTHKGKPVSFPADADVKFKVISDRGINFGIPLNPDGTFKIGWMPVGKYAVTLTVVKNGAAGKGSGQSTYTVPGGLEIQTGKTDYTVELGDGWKG